MKSFYRHDKGDISRRDCVECLRLYTGISRATAYRYYDEFISNLGCYEPA